MDPNTWTQYYSRLNQVAAPQQEQPTYANAPQFLLAQQIRYEDDQGSDNTDTSQRGMPHRYKSIAGHDSLELPL